jgi:hypothetical protein
MKGQIPFSAGAGVALQNARDQLRRQQEEEKSEYKKPRRTTPKKKIRIGLNTSENFEKAEKKMEQLGKKGHITTISTERSVYFIYDYGKMKKGYAYTLYDGVLSKRKLNKVI